MIKYAMMIKCGFAPELIISCNQLRCDAAVCLAMIEALTGFCCTGSYVTQDVDEGYLRSLEKSNRNKQRVLGEKAQEVRTEALAAAT